MSSYSGERRGSSAALSIALFAVAFNAGSLLARALDNTEGKIRGAQITNEQLYDQLEPSHDLNHLIVDPSKHTFTFQEGAENCAGKYEGDQQQAHVVGQLACTQEVPATK